MKISLKNVSTVALFSSSLALVACADGYDGELPDRGSFDGAEVADTGAGTPPPIVVDPPNGIQDPLPAVFATGQLNARGLTVTDESIYWTTVEDGKAILNWQHIDGGDPFPVDSLPGLPFATVADDVGLYFSDVEGDAIVFAPHLGLTPTTLHESTAPLALELVNDFAYWTSADGCVYRGHKEGGAAEKVSCGDGSPVSLSVVADTAYWTTAEGSLFTSGIKPGAEAIKVLSDENFTAGILADQSGVSWVDDQQRAVKRFDFLNQEVLTLSTGQFAPAAMAQDRFFLYFTTHSDGSVKRVLKTGGELETLADGQDAPGELVVTDEFLYWINEGDDSVMRLTHRSN